MDTVKIYGEKSVLTRKRNLFVSKRQALPLEGGSQAKKPNIQSSEYQREACPGNEIKRLTHAERCVKRIGDQTYSRGKASRKHKFFTEVQHPTNQRGDRRVKKREKSKSLPDLA